MWGWLPKVYYDLVARAAPGALVVLGAVYLRDGPQRGIGFVMRGLCSQDYYWVCRFAIGLMGAYLIGLALGELGDMIAGRLVERRDLDLGSVIMRECLDEHNRTAAITGARQLSIPASDLPSSDLMWQQLAVTDRFTGSRLLALRAEQRFCLVVVLGLILLALFNLLLYTADLVPKRLVVEGLMIVGILVLWRRSTRLYRRSVRQTCLAWFTSTSGGSAA
jgi:hypothetical protein